MFSTSKSENQKSCPILEQVFIHRDKGEYAKAESILLKHIHTVSEKEEYVHQLMQIQFTQGKGSVEFLTLYAAQFPNYFPLQRDIVAMLLHLGELEKAQEKMVQNFEVFEED